MTREYSGNSADSLAAAKASGAPTHAAPAAAVAPLGAGGQARPGLVVYAAADLIWATKIKGTADALDIPCRPVRSLEMLESRLADSRVVALLVDLETGQAGREMLQRLRAGAKSEGERRIAVVAFGPHVDAAGLADAQAAGADAVLARGALHARLAEVLKALTSGAGERIGSRLED